MNLCPGERSSRDPRTGRPPRGGPSTPVRPSAAAVSPLTPEAQLARAQRLGHRPAVEGAGAVQRYYVINPSNLAAEKNATVTTQDIARTRYGSAYRETSFTTLEKKANPRATRADADPVSGAASREVRLPKFRVSESGTLAVPDAGQAKNFYAETETVDNANAVFQDAAAALRLTTGGHGISVPSDPSAPSTSPPRRLKKVHAAREVPADAQNAARLEVADTFDSMNCDDFIQMILGAATGASRRAVLQNEEARVEVPAQTGQEPVAALTRHMTRKTPLDPEKAGRLLAAPEPSGAEIRQGQTAYENQHPDTRRARALRLGINEFANPEVGEGLVIRSQSTAAGPQGAEAEDEDKAGGYLQALEELEAAEATLDQGRSNASARVQNMLRTWGEHYAGVVAKDGSDAVTLENYNRKTEIGWEHERIFNNLFRDFEEFQTLVAGQVASLARTPNAETIRNLVQTAAQAPDLQQEYAEALAEAQASFIQGLEQTERTLGGNSFFAMYGPGDQSFHAAYQGTTANAVTLHIREEPKPVADESRIAVRGLADLTGALANGVGAHSVPNVTADLQLLLQQAQVDVRGLRAELRQADTRAAFSGIDARATAAKMALRDAFRARPATAYETITDNTLQGNSAGNLRTAVSTYVGSYKGYQKFGTRYKSITALNTLLTALTASMP